MGFAMIVLPTQAVVPHAVRGRIAEEALDVIDGAQSQSPVCRAHTQPWSSSSSSSNVLDETLDWY